MQLLLLLESYIGTISIMILPNITPTPTPTLLTIIQQLQLPTPTPKKPPTQSPLPVAFCTPKQKWKKQDDKLLLQLLLTYGEDLSLIHSHFPSLSRKQIRRKMRTFGEKNRKVMRRVQEEVRRDRRKSFFDQEVLEEEKCEKGTED